MTVTEYMWDPDFDTVMKEEDEFGVTTAKYDYEPVPYGRLISQKREDETNYYHYDGLGSTNALTDTNGDLTDTYENDAWGNTTASTGITVNPYRWIGELGYYLDAETQSMSIRARVYDPKVARWTCVDPLRFAEGANLYIAFLNDPATNVDPSGMFIAVWLLPWIHRCDPLVGYDKTTVYNVEPCHIDIIVGHYTKTAHTLNADNCSGVTLHGCVTAGGRKFFLSCLKFVTIPEKDFEPFPGAAPKTGEFRHPDDGFVASVRADFDAGLKYAKQICAECCSCDEVEVAIKFVGFTDNWHDRGLLRHLRLRGLIAKSETVKCG